MKRTMIGFCAAALVFGALVLVAEPVLELARVVLQEITAEELPVTTLERGETVIAWEGDVPDLRIGDGSTAGGISVREGLATSVDVNAAIGAALGSTLSLSVSNVTAVSGGAIDLTLGTVQIAPAVAGDEPVTLTQADERYVGQDDFDERWMLMPSGSYLLASGVTHEAVTMNGVVYNQLLS